MSNLGIYGNSNRVAIELRGDADLYLWVEGDDSICDGYFKALQDFIINNKVDLGSNFGIFSNWQTVTPEGECNINYNNKNILLDHPPFSLYLHGLVSWRGSVFSKKVLEKFSRVYTEGGIGLAELLFDSQWFQYLSEKYYLPVVGTSYYTQYGISTTLGIESDWQKEEMRAKWSYLLENVKMSRKDQMWAKYIIRRAEYMIMPSIIKFIASCFYFFLGAYPQNINTIGKMKKVLSPFIIRLKYNRE